MSARMFFHRFPDLYEFLLNEMTNIAKVILAGSVTPEESALYPILIIIAKLQPSLIVSGENLAEKKYQVRHFGLFFILEILERHYAPETFKI